LVDKCKQEEILATPMTGTGEGRALSLEPLYLLLLGISEFYYIRS